ncbi:Protein of unknown function [Noviherbaspirillum humi]|uniref:DUF2863 domain-containing protein n=1 Tax=Noviherbaspirillum humi TaxID=1688639 RepID=A0A239F4F5_9BURK|nr:DUF2863 family protein [Noviherbaspirillum humi]SNS51388.1 Protein of unknown function [Noviherbaspirillum humi]
MSKKKQPPTSESSPAIDPRNESLADQLVALALDLRDTGDYAVLSDDMKKARAELRKAIRICLKEQREPALAEALERTYEEDLQAHVVLRANVEALSQNVIFRRDGGKDVEVDAFVVPLLVQTAGGLRSDQCFQDEEAFERLRDSFQEEGLESRKARVVLVSHAYHPEEIRRIGYCQLHAMVHEASDAMSRKRATAADAIARSLSGWPPSEFAPEDKALELRFLLGFSLKALDDPFYQVPEKEAAADRYFEGRAERFRQWSQRVTPLLQRCLVTDGREARIDFLYQDLFHGGKAAAQAELDMLGLLAEVQQMLEAGGVTAESARAQLELAEGDDGPVLRVSLAAADGAALGEVEQPLDPAQAPEGAIADMEDALMSIGIASIQVV